MAAAAKSTVAKFKTLFRLFAKCHDTYSAVKPIFDSEIRQFRKYLIHILKVMHIYCKYHS